MESSHSVTTSTPTSSHQPRKSLDLVRAGLVAVARCVAPTARAQRRLPSSMTPTCRGRLAAGEACGEPALVGAVHQVAKPQRSSPNRPLSLTATPPGCATAADVAPATSPRIARRADHLDSRSRRNLRSRRLLVDAMTRLPARAPIERAARDVVAARQAPAARLDPPRHVPARPSPPGSCWSSLAPARRAADRRRGLRGHRGAAVRHPRALPPRHLVTPWCRLLKRLDHSNIFLIIAGTYTPFAVRCCPPTQARTLLLVVWGGAVAGVLFRVFWVGAPRWLYTPVYVALGWVAVFYLPDFVRHGGPGVVALIAVGGAALHARRRRLRDQAAQPEPALVRLPRDLPRLHGRGVRRALRRRVDVGLRPATPL